MDEGQFSVAVSGTSMDDFKKAVDPRLKERQMAIDAAKGDAIKAGYYYPAKRKVRGSDKWSFLLDGPMPSNFGGMPEMTCLGHAPG
jgi:hypothetical protein